MKLNAIHNAALINFLARKGAKEHVPLAPYSTLKIGGPARFFVTPNTKEDVALIERAAFEHGLNLHLLSGGSNTLFSDEGFLGIVMKLNNAFDFIDQSTDGQLLRIGAATSFAKVTK